MQPPALLFLAAFISFYISRYHFWKIFRTSFNIIWKKNFHDEFSIFNGLTQTHSLNSQNPLSVKKGFCQCPINIPYIFSFSSYWIERQKFARYFVAVISNVISINIKVATSRYPLMIFKNRPLNSHSFTVCHTVVSPFSRSHGRLFISHGFTNLLQNSQFSKKQTQVPHSNTAEESISSMINENYTSSLKLGSILYEVSEDTLIAYFNGNHYQIYWK